MVVVRGEGRGVVVVRGEGRGESGCCEGRGERVVVVRGEGRGVVVVRGEGREWLM